MVLTRIAWAAIVTSAHRFSQDLQTRTWHSWLTFSYKLSVMIAQGRTEIRAEIDFMFDAYKSL